MECREIQDRLLDDSSGTAKELPADIAEHLKSCPACRAFADDMTKMDQAVRNLPVPAQSASARERFLGRLDLQDIGAATQDRLVWRVLNRWHLAAAAAVLLAMGIGLWIIIGAPDGKPVRIAASNSAQPAAKGLPDIDKCVEWNMQIAGINSLEERRTIYDANVGKFRQLLDQTPVGSEDAALVRTLLDNGAWLCQNNDPLAEAEKFNVVADVLVDQMSLFAGKSDDETIRKAGRRFDEIDGRALNAALAKAMKENKSDADRARRIENIINRCAERQNRMEKMMEKTSGMSKKETQQLLENVRQRHMMRRFMQRNNQRPSSSPAMISARTAEYM